MPISFIPVEKLKNENLELKILIREGSGASGTGDGGANALSNVKIQELEKKVLAQQEELTDLHKRKGENSQMIINQNLKIADLTRTLSEKDHVISEQELKIRNLTQELEDLKASYNTMKDESISAYVEKMCLSISFL